MDTTVEKTVATASDLTQETAKQIVAAVEGALKDNVLVVTVREVDRKALLVGMGIAGVIGLVVGMTIPSIFGKDKAEEKKSA